jgi:hypothetical protein
MAPLLPNKTRDFRLMSHVASEARLVRGSDVLRYVERSGPKVGEVMQAAWDAQVAGKFSDRIGVEEWLRRHFEVQ